jgi:hypothetical protein
LHTAQGDALLSDFGAAAFFDINNAALAQGLEKLEVRALGCLLEELVMLCDANPSETTQHQILYQLTQQCLCDQTDKRPSLTHISEVLNDLAKKHDCT